MTDIQKNQIRPAGGSPFNFDDFITRDGWNQASNLYPMQFTNLPATNVRETQDLFIIELVAPGLTHENLSISTTESMLDIRYEPVRSLNFEPMDTRRDWHSEYRPQAFRRQFELNPDVVDCRDVSISSQNGLIRFEIPKREEFRGKVLPLIPFSPN